MKNIFFIVVRTEVYKHHKFINLYFIIKKQLQQIEVAEMKFLRPVAGYRRTNQRRMKILDRD
jgi:hypothetical protein